MFLITSYAKPHLDANLWNSFQNSLECVYSDLLTLSSPGTFSLATAMADVGWRSLKSAAPSSTKAHHQKQFLLFWASPWSSQLGMHTFALSRACRHTTFTHTPPPSFIRNRELRQHSRSHPSACARIRPVIAGVLEGPTVAGENSQ